MTAHPVSFEELLKVLEYQGISETDILPGDVLLIRFGYIGQYEGMCEERRAQLDAIYKKQKPENIGVEPSKEFLEFLWDKKIAAVAGDTRSFEVWPCSQTQWHLHEWLLAGWGMPIGELFDLENLSRTCEELNRYTFFFTSSPMNVRCFPDFLSLMANVKPNHLMRNRHPERSQVHRTHSHFSKFSFSFVFQSFLNVTGSNFQPSFKYYSPLYRVCDRTKCSHSPVS